MLPTQFSREGVRQIELDVFADPDLEDWQEVAKQLGFRSLVAGTAEEALSLALGADVTAVTI